MKIIPAISLTHIQPDPRLSNTIEHWGFFTKEEVEQAATDGSLLMLDIDFGRGCPHRCPGCFRRNNPIDASGLSDLSYREIFSVVDQAKKLGLRSVKICGAGEPLVNPNLLRFARDLTKRDIGLAIFTKGYTLGDDELAAKIFGPRIESGLQLAEQLFSLKTSVMLSYPSFDADILGALVGGSPRDYPQKLKKAAEILAEAGFNKTLPTRLAFVHAPITGKSIAGAFEVYRFARERNILPILAFYMVSGKQITPAFLRRNDAAAEEKIRLARRIYEYNLAHGFNTPEQLARENISCMPGIHPCNQIAVGLYLTANGNVIRCPGDREAPLGNVRETSLGEIWKKARDWNFKGKFNVGCPFKEGITLPVDYQQRVFGGLSE